MEAENEQKLIFSGRNVEEALQNARDKLGLDPFTQLSYKVIEESAKKKFLLFGAQKREVRIEIHFSKSEPSDEEEDDAQIVAHQDVKQMVADVWNTTAPSPTLTNSTQQKQHPNRRPPPQRNKPEVRTNKRRKPRNDRNQDQQRPQRNVKAPSQAPKKPAGPPISDEALTVLGNNVKSLFEKMGLDLTLTLERSIKNPGIVRVQPEGKDCAWLYSQKSAFIQSLEELTLKMLRTRYDEEQRCQLYFVGLRSFRRSHTNPVDDKKLVGEVEKHIAKIIETGEPVVIGPYNAFERRLIHRRVSEADGLTTESQGDGSSKMVTIQKLA